MQQQQQETVTYSGPERRTRDRAMGLLLRRRQQRHVEEERRRNTRPGFDIAAELEMHLDQCNSRHAMVRLLQGWLSEARSGEPDGEYVSAVERAIEIIKREPDLETAIAVLQRQ